MVIGDGPQMALIRQLAKDNIQILGAVSDRIVAERHIIKKGHRFWSVKPEIF